MFARILILSACLILGAAYIATASKTEVVPPRQSLSSFPYEIDRWRGRNQQPFAPDILEVLGVDEYLTRLYQSNGRYADLYIGFYESQRQGDTIHSPLNCLPGSGWEPVSKDYLTISVPTDRAGERSITVNQYVIQKGLDQQVVLYWYQSHGRVVANEYRSKMFMVYDAVRLNRTDAALVRVVSPRIGSGPEAEASARATAVAFVKSMFPLLDKYLPS
ncbi:MAG TPA: EpsI family protein [Vicinamibacterales bacterium]|nr:EpsI family protein [Vicinamibacterales bacterium]